MTKPAPLDLDIYQGDSVDLLVRIKARNVSTGLMEYRTLVTGDIGKAQIRTTKSASTVLAEFVCTNTNQSTTPGGILLRLDPAATSSISASEGVWDFEVSFANGDRKTVLAGQVNFTGDVTRG